MHSRKAPLAERTDRCFRPQNKTFYFPQINFSHIHYLIYFNTHLIFCGIIFFFYSIYFELKLITSTFLKKNVFISINRKYFIPSSSTWAVICSLLFHGRFNLFISFSQGGSLMYMREGRVKIHKLDRIACGITST